MTPEDYLALTKELSIKRGQLDDGFISEAVVRDNNQPNIINPNAGMKRVPPPITEDLSRFFPTAQYVKAGRLGGRSHKRQSS